MAKESVILAGRPDFEVAPYDLDIFNQGWQRFRCGTVHGLWRASRREYEILAVINDQPGNGHFAAVLSWFYDSCKRDGFSLRISEVWNKSLADHLQRNGFKREKDDFVKKQF